MRTVDKIKHKVLALFAVAAFLSLASGCAVNPDETVLSPGGVALAGIDAGEDENVGVPDELVEIPELPADDGSTLSREERIAFHSTGELDSTLSAEEKLLVERHFKFYLHGHRATFERYLQRVENYLPYVRQVFKEMGVPEEIAYLAIVESGFNPNAVSRVGATGMWQFMKYTGVKYGLSQSAWLDERRDPYKATVAAATYLLKLYSMFEDWHLAIASYNAGEGKILRALGVTGAETFFELYEKNSGISHYKTRLRPETQQYVPRFLAVVKIMRNLELLGFTEPDPEKGRKVVSLKVGPGTDLGALARNAGMSWDEFRSHNPAYRRNISPPNASSMAYVPAWHGEQAKIWLSKAESTKFAGWQQYKVRAGDNLYAISRKCGISVALLQQANGLKGSSLRQGAVLLVPGTSAGALAKNSAQSGVSVTSRPVSPVSISGSGVIHTVISGESLHSIAEQYGVTVISLRTANSMGRSSSIINVGQKLRIPGKAELPAAEAPQQVQEGVFVVQKGDTLYSIALRNNTNVDDLARANGLNSKNPVIYPGQKLRLPKAF